MKCLFRAVVKVIFDCLDVSYASKSRVLYHKLYHVLYRVLHCLLDQMTVEYSIDIKRSEERSIQRTHTSTQDLPLWYVNISTLTKTGQSTGRKIGKTKPDCPSGANSKFPNRPVEVHEASCTASHPRRLSAARTAIIAPAVYHDSHRCDLLKSCSFFCQLVCRFSLLKVALIFTARFFTAPHRSTQGTHTHIIN